MKKYVLLFIIKLILAFCSIVYELILAQSLSAFLENTVLRYSVTIGLYMCSMGFGALMAESKFVKYPILNLLRIEIFLTVLGGFSVIFLHSLEMLDISRLMFSVFAHSLIISIGFLTGFELPLLIEIINSERKNSENMTIAFDYIGAFLGTLIFAFIFYPKTGLVGTSLFVGYLNAVAGFMLYIEKHTVQKEAQKAFRTCLVIQFILLITIAACLYNSSTISLALINQYIQ